MGNKLGKMVKNINTLFILLLSISISANIPIISKKDFEERDNALFDDEIAQIYISFKGKGYRVPNSKLIGLKRVKLKAGESKKIKFSIRPEDIQNIDQNGDNVFYKGKYKLTIGACSPWNKSSR